MNRRIAICFTLTLLCLLLLLPNAVAETREGVIWLEGMEEPIEETLFESPEGFSFWYASDMLAADFETEDDVEGVVVRNPYSDDAMVLFMISEEEAVEYAQNLDGDIVAQSAQARVQADVYCELENSTYNFMTLIAENGRYLCAVGSYYEEAAEGTAKYFQLVLDSVAFTGGTLYAGIDPWGNPLSVTLTRADALSGIWSQNFFGNLFIQNFDNARDGFLLEGPLGDDDDSTCRYAGSMTLDGDALTVTFTDGEITTESTEGGSTAYHVAALADDQRTATLVPAVPGDYSGVTTLDASDVEAFAAWVRQLYLNADWDAMAQLIEYPITLYPDVEINDADAFVAFLADKVMAESDMDAMTAENCVGMMSNGQGICMGSGQVWLRDIAFDGVEQIGEPDLRVIALSGLAN